MRVEDNSSPLAVTDTVDATVFEAYLERVLLPHLRPGRIMMLDNLSAHKSDRVGKLIEGVGREPVDLPSYSPDFNPIELAFSKLKTKLRQLQARTREALEKAIRAAVKWIRSFPPLVS